MQAALTGVYHDNGYKVASDAIVLVAIKSDYPEELEHHIIDKDTLYPAAYFSSLTVVTRDSALADALSTALFCMPAEEGLKLAENIGGVELLWIFPDGTSQSTPGFADLIEEPEES